MGDRGGQVGDSRRVPPHVGVLGLEGIDERLERRDRQTLELHPLTLQLGGPGGDFLLEPLVEVAVLEQHLAALERALHRAAQVGQLDRLGEVIHGAALHAQRGAGRVVDGGEHEDRELRLDLERGGHEVHAACAGHADVAQHERDAMALELLQRFVP